MKKVDFLASSCRDYSTELNAEFVVSIRQHAVGEGRPTAYVVPVSQVIEGPVESDEMYVVIVMPELKSDGIELCTTSVTPQVRARADGTPVACALLANGRVAVHAHALNEAHPLNAGRLTVLWMFQDICALCHYPYGEDLEEWFSAASMVADGRRHETDHGTNIADEKEHEENVIEVLNFFTVEAAG